MLIVVVQVVQEKVARVPPPLLAQPSTVIVLGVLQAPANVTMPALCVSEVLALPA